MKRYALWAAAGVGRPRGSVLGDYFELKTIGHLNQLMLVVRVSQERRASRLIEP